MNWKRAYKIQQRIEYFDQQIEILNQLATRINDDHKSIHIYIEHEQHALQNQPEFPMPLMQFMNEDIPENKKLDFDPFHMALKDEWGMDFIGQILTVLKAQRDRLKSKLQQEQNVMYRVYVDGIGNVEQTENNQLARKAFESFRDMSKEDFGNVGGKHVYLYKGNETLASHEPQIKGDHHG